MTQAIMLQGTASDVGKSVLVADCAAFLSGWSANRTVQIAEYGAQLRYYPGGERDGRAQIFRAEAAGLCQMSA